MPRLAATYVLNEGQKYLVDRFTNRTDDDAREIETLAAGMKAYASWFAVDVLQHCRETCGGQGYLAVNRFGALKADTDIFVTFEGDNTVLTQLVAKGLLTSYRHQFGEMRLWGIVKFVADRAATAVAQLNPLVTRKTDPDHLRDPDFLLSAFEYRESRLLQTVATRLKSRIDDGIDTFVAFNECQDHLLALGHAHVERVLVERALFAKRTATDEQLKNVLGPVVDLWALWRLEEDRGWFLENGFFEGNKAKAIRNLTVELCREVRELAPLLTEAFAIPDAVLWGTNRVWY